MGVTLYPHQTDAVQWMCVTENRPRMVPQQPHGGILAHAMGLGKTISMLSMIWSQPPGTTLVVCPKSLLLQWRKEAVVVGFAPADIITYHGNQRSRCELGGGKRHTLVLTTFDIVRIEKSVGKLCGVVWDRVVLDEAHRICEQSSKTARVIRSIRARNRWCITGTPFKNGVSDLLALSRFLMIAPYCNLSWWRMHQHSQAKLKEWRRLFLNMKDKSVLTTLPAVKHHNLDITLSQLEREIYAQISDITWGSREEEDVDTVESSEQHELLRILRQRQATNHPLLIAPADVVRNNSRAGEGEGCEGCGGGVTTTTTTLVCDTHSLCDKCAAEPMCFACMMQKLRVSGDTWNHSSKTRALWNYLRDVALVQQQGSAKVVVFSQWTSCLDLLGNMLAHYGVQFSRYDGRVNSTEERNQVIVDARADPRCKVLLTSLGAGGEGVNLTFASHVILMEPYWNMAVEQQAVDRLHRIGQVNVTNVVRFVVVDSVEEWVQSIQRKKMFEQRRLIEGWSTPPSPSVKCGGGGGTKRVAPKYNSRACFDQEEGGGGGMCTTLGAFMKPAKTIKLM